MTRDFDALFRTEARRVFATLVRLRRDFDLAEEALSEAFRAAQGQWPREGVPAKPRRRGGDGDAPPGEPQAGPVP